MDFDKCQKKYCPVNKKELNIQKKELYNRNEKCKKLFTDYSKKTIKKAMACNQRAYRDMEKINKRGESCIRKHCKYPLKTQRNKVKKIISAWVKKT